MTNFDNLKKGDLVLVTWQDCASHGSRWVDQEDMDEWLGKEHVIKTVGWIYSQSEKHILIYSTDDSGNKAYRMIFELYKPQVIDIVQLREGQPNMAGLTLPSEELVAEARPPIPFPADIMHRHNCVCMYCEARMR